MLLRAALRIEGFEERTDQRRDRALHSLAIDSVGVRRLVEREMRVARQRMRTCQSICIPTVHHLCRKAVDVTARDLAANRLRAATAA